MKCLHQIIMLLLTWFFISCNGRVNKAPFSENHEEITMDIESRIYSAQELFDSCRIVALETKPDSFLASIGRLYLYGDNIYILDDRLHSVLVFDNEGRFIHKYHRLGRGPGEYIQLSDFAIDSGGDILLMADIPGKIIIQDSIGNIKGQIPIEEAYMDLCIRHDSLFFANPPTSKSAFSLMTTHDNKTQAFVRAISPYNYYFIHGRSLTYTNHQIIIARRFDPIVYSFEEGFVSTSTFHFKPNPFLSQNELKEIGKSPQFFDYCKKNQRVFCLIDCQRISDIWIVNTNLPYCFIYSSKSGQNYTVRAVEDKDHQLILGGFSRIAVNGDNIDEICFVLKEEGLKQIGKDASDNPVLVFYRLRKDL